MVISTLYNVEVTAICLGVTSHFLQTVQKQSTISIERGENQVSNCQKLPRLPLGIWPFRRKKNSERNSIQGLRLSLHAVYTEHSARVLEPFNKLCKKKKFFTF